MSNNTSGGDPIALETRPKGVREVRFIKHMKQSLFNLLIYTCSSVVRCLCEKVWPGLKTLWYTDIQVVEGLKFNFLCIPRVTIQYSIRCLKEYRKYHISFGWWFQMVFMFIPIWGNDPI